ncbi:MAG: division/cell wall cluster transcriptional repressor MraZ [Desulfomonilia bacterium]
MLKGHLVNSMNDKGRLSIPSRFREILSEWDARHLVITKGLDRCLVAFAPDDWERMEKIASRLSMVRKADIVFKRHVVGSAEECPIDAQGRILIPQHLREYAQLKKKCLFVGITDRFEIWDPNNYEAFMDDSLKDPEGMREDLAIIGL